MPQKAFSVSVSLSLISLFAANWFSKTLVTSQPMQFLNE